MRRATTKAGGRLRFVVLAACVCGGIARGQSGATTTTLRLPTGIAYDASGNLFIADAARHQVIEVAISGAVSVIAGTGVQGFSGDGGAATAAELDSPQALAIAGDGTISIADTGNQRVRRVANGLISTIAGSGMRGFNGDGAALTQELCRPSALALDAAGGLLIADTCNHRVRRLAGGVLTTVAGTGVQGFGGDGGSATQAMLDSPAGLAVDAAGRLFIADTRNNRIRVIATDGTITTFAGSGVRGFSGDGGPALVAALDHPSGLAVTPGGALLFADRDNQRLREIDASGNVSTLGGAGTEGTSPNGTLAASANIDQPRGIAVSPGGAPTLADAHDHAVQEIAADSRLYLIAAANGGATAALTLVAPQSAIYGSGAMQADVASTAPAATGNVTLNEGGVLLTSAALVSGSASLPLTALSAGMHTLTAVYAGDVLHSASTSAPATVLITPLSVTATANAATITYGDAIPALQGTVSGILPRDAASVSVAFTTSAPSLAPVGSYAITATLSGVASGNYNVVLAGGSGSLQVLQAQSSIMLATTQQSSYAGLPLVLTATVAPPTRGQPTGIVNFMDSGVIVATGSLANGTVSATWLAPSQGAHTLTASYMGDTNFFASSSVAEVVSIGAMPDFTLAVSGSATQTIAAGSAASYSFLISANPAPFAGSVVFSVANMPTGATATFSPSAVIPGSASVPVTLTIQTSPRASVRSENAFYLALLPAFLLFLRGRNRCSALRSAAFCSVLACIIISLTGCGNRTIGSQAATTSTLIVTATSTNLAGSVLTHTTTLNLLVE